MVVFLHCYDPRNIIERDSAEAEIGVIGDDVDLLDERVKVWRFDAVDRRDEVCR